MGILIPSSTVELVKLKAHGFRQLALQADLHLYEQYLFARIGVDIKLALISRVNFMIILFKL